MSLFELNHSPYSAFVPCKNESAEVKTNFSSNGNKHSECSTIAFQVEPSSEVPTTDKIKVSSDTNFNSLEKKLDKKERKGSLKIKRENAEFDFEYKPHVKVCKKEVNSKLNENRNILPNTIHQLFSFAQRRNRSGHVVERIFKKFRGELDSQERQTYNASRFYIYQKHLKNKIGNYVTEESLKSVCTNAISPELFDLPEERFYCKVFRILLLSYLEEEANCSVLMSKRMYSDKKVEHIKINRYIIEAMKSKFPKAALDF